MDNTSKSLIITGAILLSILIISIGIYIYNNSVNSTKSAMASKEMEMQLMQFNKQYEMYEGIQTANSIKQLLNIASQNNSKLCEDDNDKKLCVCIRSKSKKILSKVTHPEVKKALTTRDNGLRYPSNIKDFSLLIGDNEKYNISFEYNEYGYIWEIWINDID